MYISLTNTIGAIRTAVGIVRKNLQLWLDFEKSEVIGGNVYDGDIVYEVNGGTFTDNGNGTYTVTGNGTPSVGIGVRDFNADYLVVGNSYTFSVVGANTTVAVYDTSFNLITSGVGSVTFLASTTAMKLYISPTDGVTATYSSVSVKEVTQFAKDKSPNTNNAKLFTGKALSFGGNDYVNLGSQAISGSDLTLAAWVEVSDLVGTEAVFTYGDFMVRFNNDDIQVFGDVGGAPTTFSAPITTSKTRLVVTISGNNSSLHLDGILLETKSVISLSSDFRTSYIGSYNGGSFFNGGISDVQLYNSAWQQSDVTFDYNNPNHLVTDNPNSTIALSNLKGYWALSEGQGGFAYNSAVALGSEEVVNGGFDTDLSGWTGNGVWDNQTNRVDIDSLGSYAYTQDLNIGLVSGSAYVLTFKAKGSAANTLRIQDNASNLGGLTTTNGGTQLLTTDFVEYTRTFTANSSSNNLIFSRNNGAEVSWSFFIDDVSVKEVSAGVIYGINQYVDAQPNIPQLGMQDWAKSTIGSDEITLIQDPNNKGYDILGNPLRLREHGFNLDGTGYGEVADDDSLDFGTGDFTLEAWVKADYINTGSVFNAIYSINGNIANATGLGFYTDATKVYYRIGGATNSFIYTQDKWYYLAISRDSSNNFKFYKGEDGVVSEVASGNNTIDFTSTEVKYVGKGSTTNSARNYKNLIDEPRAYNRGLSLKEITQNYKAGINKHKATSSFSDDFSSDYGL